MREELLNLFVKKYNDAGSDDRVSMVEDLFRKWVVDFQRSSNRSPKRVLKGLRNQNATWQKICDRIEPVDDGWHFVDCNFMEYWVQIVEQVAFGVYSTKVIDSVVLEMGMDPEEVRRLENTRIELQMEVK